MKCFSKCFWLSEADCTSNQVSFYCHLFGEWLPNVYRPFKQFDTGVEPWGLIFWWNPIQYTISLPPPLLSLSFSRSLNHLMLVAGSCLITHDFPRLIWLQSVDIWAPFKLKQLSQASHKSICLYSNCWNQVTMYYVEGSFPGLCSWIVNHFRL